jgi:hypothetical protein
MNRKLGVYGAALGAALTIVLQAPKPALADDPPADAAPPVATPTAPVAVDSGTPSVAPAATTADSSVFSWHEIPANQQVPITRAVFDKGGYVLYDTVGETITVPFTNSNLYVMKFARSTTGDMYFVNDGTAPILYVPDGAYLENAAVPGSKWYPFSQDYHPTEPVYVGIAPSYAAFCDMGWYPDMVCWGGYWGYTPFVVGGVFFPEVGLSFFIGGHYWYGWNAYHSYYFGHPAPFHVGLVFGGYYHGGFGHGGLAGAAFGNHVFHGGTVAGGGAFHGGGLAGDRTALAGGHTFRGTRSYAGGGYAGQAFHGGSFSGGGHVFQGARGFGGGGFSSSGGGHVFQGTRGSSGGGLSGHSSSGGGGGGHDSGGGGGHH